MSSTNASVVRTLASIGKFDSQTDQAVVQFQKAAARENRDRGSVRWRYSSTLQQQAVEYCRERQRQDDGRRDVAAALGVAPRSDFGKAVRYTLKRWRTSRDSSRIRASRSTTMRRSAAPSSAARITMGRLAPWNGTRRRLLHALRNRPPGRR